jgi:hypothetical protein
MLSRPGPLPPVRGGPSSSRLESASVLEMGDADDNVPDELDEQLDDLAEELRDPDRRDRTIEDQGEEGRIVGEGEADESADDQA